MIYIQEVYCVERPKYRYRLAFERTKQNGYYDRKRTMYVAASSEAEAKRLVKENYPDAKAFRIIGKWENTPRKTTGTKESAMTAAKAASAPKATETSNATRKTSNVKYVDPEEIIRSIWNKRKAEQVRLQEQLKVKYSQRLAELISDYDDRRKKLNHEWELMEKSIAEEKHHCKALGLFQFDKRKSIKQEIVKLKEQQEAISGELKELDENFRAEKVDLENEREAERKTLYQRSKEAFPAPTNENKFDGYDQLPIEQAVRYTRLIYLLLEMEPGERYTITDMQDFPGLSCCSNSAISSLLQHPVAQGCTIRTIERGRAYYTITIPKE